MTEITKTDYKLGQDNIRVLGLDIHNPVFVVSSLAIVAFVAGVLAFPAGATAAFGALRAWLLPTFDWAFMGAGNFFVLFCLLLVATPLGRVRLGGGDARPDYSRTTWFAMLFAAGVGIGLMFFGVSEPVEHFLQPPLGLEAADTAAARLGMVGAIYHWGIHGWAIYAVAAVSIAFASYNLGLPMTLRSGFYPLLGEAVWGRVGHGIDILAVLATLFGLAASLGLGAQQLAAGLAHLWGTPTTDTVQVLLIAGITGLALTSVISGMEKGIKRLSEANLWFAVLLLAFVLTVGPTLDIATRTVTSLGDYLAAIGPLSNWLGREDLHFMHGWTVFYWAWWISWSPFVGLFVASLAVRVLGRKGVRDLSSGRHPARREAVARGARRGGGAPADGHRAGPPAPDPGRDPVVGTGHRPRDESVPVQPGLPGAAREGGRLHRARRAGAPARRTRRRALSVRAGHGGDEAGREARRRLRPGLLARVGRGRRRPGRLPHVAVARPRAGLQHSARTRARREVGRRHGARGVAARRIREHAGPAGTACGCARFPSAHP